MSHTARVSDLHNRPEAAANYATLRQLVDVVERIDDETFVRADTAFTDSSIGKHVRHILDFYRCFFLGLEGAHVDYDDRTRDTAIETRRASAIEAACLAGENLLALDPAIDRELMVSSMTDVGVPATPCRSSIARELVFLQSHAIHHLAMAVLMMNRFGFPTEPEWGLAPSTQDYLARD